MGLVIFRCTETIKRQIHKYKRPDKYGLLSGLARIYSIHLLWCQSDGKRLNKNILLTLTDVNIQNFLSKIVFVRSI